MKTKQFLITAFFLISACSQLKAQQTIHSTAAGGWWPEPATWFESVPTAVDSVVIQGPVGTYSYSGWCKSLNITETGSLGGNGNQGNLYIYGSLYNDGNINGSINYYLQGNIVNNMPWTGVDGHILFSGMDHSITCGPGASINAQLSAEDSLHNFTLRSDVILNTPNFSNLDYSQLDAQNHKLEIAGGGFVSCRIHSLDTLQFDCTVSDLEIKGNYVLTGNPYSWYFGSVILLYGDVTNLATIPSSNLSLSIKGNFTNKDTISTNVNVEKYIQNQGNWNCYETKFTGAGNKHISQSAGHPFGGTQLMTDNSGVKIILDSDVEFIMPTVHLDNDTLSCGNYMLTANSTFYDGAILSESEIKGNSDFWNSTLKGNILLSGNNRFANCTADGVIENTGLMKDITFYGGIFKSYNHLINKGSIQSVKLNVYNDLTNWGTIDNNSIVEITGNTAQHIFLLNPVESPTYFYSDITGNSYQWMINDIDIPNQQSQSLYFSTLQLTDAGVYKCRVTTGTGTTLYSREITVNNITTVSEFPEIISGFIAYPNPFTASTRLAWEQKKGAALSLDILDIEGNVVAQLINSYSGCGKHEQELNAVNLKPGNYIARLGIKGKSQNIRIVYIK